MADQASDLLGHLGRSEVFGALDQKVLRRLVDGARTQSHRKGVTLYRWGQQADDLVVVLRGRLEVSRQVSSTRRMYLRSLEAGDIVGLSVVAGEVHSADLIAATELVVARIAGRTIRRLFRECPEVPLKMISSMGALVGDLSDEISDLRYKSLDERVLKTIGRLSRPGQRLSITQAELAAMVGATRENVARALARLEKRGLVARGRGWVELTSGSCSARGGPEGTLAQGVKRVDDRPTAPCTWDDFFQVTRASWCRVDCEPDRTPDFESGEGSRYWNTAAGVYRSSDHWNGDIHGCDWLLDGTVWQEPAIGFAPYTAFERLALPE